MLTDHHRIIRAGLAAHQGREITTMGDGFFAVFTSPSACVSAVIEMQHNLVSHSWPAGAEVRVRMGIHTGEASDEPVGPVGLEVHRAARIAAVGNGGQVLISSTTAGLLRDSLPERARLRDLGVHRLKDLGRPEQIFQLEVEDLPTKFPSLRSLENPELPNNLPNMLSAFIGRAAELTQIRDLVSSSRLMTLTGAGGSGKTRLALQVAAEMLDGSGEGVWFVELAAIADPDEVPGSVATALGIRAQSERSLFESLIDALSDQSVLLVLDNCEQVIGACAKLADRIGRSCPGVHVLATSREPLGIDGEHVYRVPPLSLPEEGADAMVDLQASDAVTLFVERASEHDSAFAFDDSIARLVGSICRRLDGIPLALELAAARLSTMSLENLSGRLDQRFRLLTGGSRNALPRQQTLYAMIDWSYDLLSEAEQGVLRRLSVFVGNFQLAAAEAICATAGLEAFEVDDLVGSLVNKSLVIAERSSESLRYRLLETVRQFGLERLVQVGGAEASRARDAHAAFYLELAETAGQTLLGGPLQGRWLKTLDLEWDNVKAALAYFFTEPGRTEAVLRLGVGLRGFLYSRGHYDAVPHLRAALDRPDTVPAALRVGALLSTAWQEVLIQGERGERRAILSAGELGNRALEMARELDDQKAAAEALTLLAEVAQCEHDHGQALLLAEEAVEVARGVDDPWLSGLAALYLADIIQWRFDYLPADLVRSRRLYLEALGHFRQAGDLLLRSVVVEGLALIEFAEGQFEASRFYLEEAIAAAEEIGYANLLPELQTNLGLILLLLGESEGAAGLFRTALLACRRRGNRSGVGQAIWGLAFCDLTGDHLRAAQLHGAADALITDALAAGMFRLSPAELRLQDDDRARLRDLMRKDEFERAYRVGSALTYEQAVDLALGRSRVA